MYKVNDVVIYHRDVCKIIGKHRSSFTGEMCYILVPYFDRDGAVRIQVPVSNKAGHLRDLISPEDGEALIKETPDIAAIESRPANMKSQYTALMKSDDISDLIRIIKTSYSRNKVRLENHKKPSSIDDEYLQRAEQYLFEELSVVLGKNYNETKAFFEGEVAKAAQGN